MVRYLWTPGGFCLFTMFSWYLASHQRKPVNRVLRESSFRQWTRCTHKLIKTCPFEIMGPYDHKEFNHVTKDGMLHFVNSMTRHCTKIKFKNFSISKFEKLLDFEIRYLKIRCFESIDWSLEGARESFTYLKTILRRARFYTDSYFWDFWTPFDHLLVTCWSLVGHLFITQMLKYYHAVLCLSS